MKVAISASSLCGRRIHDGIAHYTKDLISAMERRGTEVLAYHYKGEEPTIASRQSESGFATTVIRSQLGLGNLKHLSKQVDVIHCTDHRIPLVNAKPLVATIFDAIPMMHPEWAQSRGRKLKNCLMSRSGRWPDRVICSTQYAAAEVAEYWKVNPDIIRVVPLAADLDRFSRPISEDASKLIRSLLPRQYLLSVGTLQPRKNISALIRVHRLLPETYREEYPLVIAGASGWSSEDIEKLFEHDKYLVRLPRLSDEEIVFCYQNASALIIPSLHEGFGLPVLEGFASGTPVFCSNATSLPEVAGRGAFLFDPYSQEAMLDALMQVEKVDLLEELRMKGSKRLRDFSWEQTARMTRDVYAELL